ncbi:MAG: photosynthetic complex assembly protein PuhC [Pseudomonadota bacterium]
MSRGGTGAELFLDAERKSMRVRDQEMIPARLVWGMFGLAALALGLVTFSVATDRPLVGVAPEEPALAVHVVTIGGEGNAATVVRTDGEVLLNTDHGAFVTVVRQGLERARRMHRIAGNPPVTITEWESGRVTLYDPATGWDMQLSSFGAGNTRHFTRLFK